MTSVFFFVPQRVTMYCTYEYHVTVNNLALRKWIFRSPWLTGVPVE